MNHIRIILLLLVALFRFSVSYSQSGPDAILPTEKEVPGWRPSGEPKIYDRDNLHDFINDQAELLNEFGFRRVVIRDYYNFFGKVINIQVYTMNSTFGSYGIFLQKSKNEKVIKDFGNGCFEKANSFVFWKQYYLVMMNSISSGDTISEGFRLMARVIDSKIKSKGVLPDILQLSKNKPGNTTIFKGPLAMANIYYFSPLDIFNISEGIAIENGDAKEIILKYDDNNEAVRRFSDAAGILSGMSKFSGFLMVGELAFAMKDKEGKTLTFKVADNCLDITIK
jgi:hypothetical protein